MFGRSSSTTTTRSISRSNHSRGHLSVLLLLPPVPVLPGLREPHCGPWLSWKLF
eukprot:m.162848 g.162848  ORF g.162848 m.162848 type:complete len:54 (+) comp21015_c0_seq2:212-373(+)